MTYTSLPYETLGLSYDMCMGIWMVSQPQFIKGQCQFILNQQMQQRQTQWLHRSKLSDSNHGSAGDQQQIYHQATFSILKNESLISLLSNRLPINRTQKQCKAIAQYLKAQPYFQSIAKNHKTLLDISSWIQYKKIEEGDYIYRIHDVADCFYLLLVGEVHLTYPEKQVLEVEEEIPQDNNYKSSKNIKQEPFYPTAVPSLTKNQSLVIPIESTPSRAPKRVTRHLSLFTEEAEIQVPPPKKIAFEQRIVQMITHGESFGDVGDSNRRGTNAIAKQVSHVLIIKKQHYGVLSNAHIKSQNNVKFDMLSAIPLFQLLYRYSLESIIYLLQEVKVGYNNIIYNQNDAIKFIYITYKGEFKLYKKIRCKKDNDSNTCLQNQQQRILTKNVTFKNVELGEILGYMQTYNKVNRYSQTCVCKSQQAIILRIQKNKFMKKILSTDNSLEEIIAFINQKSAKRNQQIADFIKKHENDSFLVRYLHTPSAKPRRINTQSSAYKNRSQRNDQLRKMSIAKNNFFNELNSTIKQQVKSTRISIKKSIKFNEQRGTIPSRIKDIIGIVSQENNYYKIRKPKEDVKLFQFNLTKVPIHVKKKYEDLFKRQKR